MSVFAHKSVIVTGANRGIGKAIVEALLVRDVKRVYACARNPESIHHNDARITRVTLDITNPEQVSNLAALATDADMLINNAGTNASGSLLNSSIDDSLFDFNVNFIGTLRMIKALVPVFQNRGQGHIVNVISICGLAGMPSLGGYCVSKAGLFSASQSLRTELALLNIALSSVFPGPVDTDMNEGVEIDMASPETLAQNTLNGLERGDEDIFPDPEAENVYRLWTDHPKTLEAHFKQF